MDDRKFPQGQGKTKKEAKTAAAKIAFSEMLGIADDIDEPGMIFLTNIIFVQHKSDLSPPCLVFKPFLLYILYWTCHVSIIEVIMFIFNSKYQC